VPVTSGFNHVATLTSNMDRTVRFYQDAFEAELMFEMEAEGDHPKMSILDLGGGAALNVFEVPAHEIIGERREQGHRGAIDHFALAVDSLGVLEALRDRLVGAGAEIGEIQQLGSEWSLFFRDPDGMELEVCTKVDVYDLDGDGKVSVIEHERARLGLVDARLEQIAEEGGLKGSLAEAAHKVLDKLDNDG
jgi:catechol 2,3-dioxygenase-like lactoylglutathione lyase family enzyme